MLESEQRVFNYLVLTFAVLNWVLLLVLVVR